MECFPSKIHILRGELRGGKLHINKPDDSQTAAAATTAGAPSLAGRAPSPPRVSLGQARRRSLLELQRPHVLRPTSPSFGFLVVAAHGTFQDLVLWREEAEKRETPRDYLLAGEGSGGASERTHPPPTFRPGGGTTATALWGRDPSRSFCPGLLPGRPSSRVGCF